MYETLIYTGGVHKSEEIKELIEDLGGFILQDNILQMELVLNMAVPLKDVEKIEKNIEDVRKLINEITAALRNKASGEDLKTFEGILNNKLAAYVEIVKKDAETGKIIKLADTSFKILNTDTNQYVSQYVGGKVLDTFTTDESGKTQTYLKLEAGNYKIVEIKTPKG